MAISNVAGDIRVAVVHDYLYTVGGAELVLQGILRCFPGADVFTLFDVLRPEERLKIGFVSARTSFLQKMPGIAKRHRLYLPLMPLAIEQFDLSGYDLVISSSYAVAKGVLTGPDQLHLAYVHSPMRYAWDLQHQCLEEAGMRVGIKGVVARMLLHRLRIWDARTSNGVDAFAVNSHFIGRRVRKAYGRTARVIHPPVRIASEASPDNSKQDFFLTASRLVPYKNVRMIVEAFSRLPSQRLVVAGSGPELARLQALAGPNVSFTGFIDDQDLRHLMRTTKAFVFAAEEDFGIVLVEAQSEGAPVIALGRGGARETVICRGPRQTGLFFDQPTPGKIALAIRQFLSLPQPIDASDCRRNALKFREERFDSEFAAFVDEQLSDFRSRVEIGLATAPVAAVADLHPAA